MTPEQGTLPAPVPEGVVPDPVSRRRQRRAWYFYDWANSAYVTTTSTVLIGPYLTAVARADACPDLAAGEVCRTDLSVLGLPVAPGALVPYVIGVSTVLGALLLPVVGAVADRSGRKKQMLGAFAWVGAAAAACLALVTGGNWQLGVLLLVVANINLMCSLVVYDALLCQVATPDERDRVSSRGWALGYLGGFLLLGANLAVVLGHEALGLTEPEAVRLSLLTAGLWWGLFTLVPVIGLRNRQPIDPVGPDGAARPDGSTLQAVRGSFAQLLETLRDLRGYRNTWLFLLAYLFFNDGIQTVISSSSLYGSEELGFEQAQLIQTILLVQLVAVFGALLFGRAAVRYGAKRCVLVGISLWLLVVVIGFVMPAGQFVLFLGLAVLIGLVMGGTQALSRSLYSQLVPVGREAEYFSLYQAAERGTSWFGAVLFGLVYQLTDSYRPAIVSLMVFFVVGGLLLSRVDVRQGIVDAGNVPPKVV
jgi:UMF1 family MFS transporter